MDVLGKPPDELQESDIIYDWNELDRQEAR